MYPPSQVLERLSILLVISEGQASPDTRARRWMAGQRLSTGERTLLFFALSACNLLLRKDFSDFTILPTVVSGAARLPSGVQGRRYRTGYLWGRNYGNQFARNVSSGTFSSMGKRLEMRFGMALPVRIWGLDADGQIFEEEATTIDVTTTGARIRGVTRSLHRGCVIGIKHKNSSARYRVTWIGEAENGAGRDIGVQLLEGGKFIWGRVIPRMFIDQHEEAPKKQ